VPTEAGLELYTLLSEAAPLLVDPGTTALWELRLDGILQHASDVIQVVDEIAAEADRLIEVLKQQRGRAIALIPAFSSSPAARTKEESGRRRRARLPPGPKPGNRRMAQADAGTAPGDTGPVRQAAGFTARTPTTKMISFARSLARARKVSLPEGVETDYQVCRSFLDAHAPARLHDNSPGRRSQVSTRRGASSSRPARGDEMGWDESLACSAVSPPARQQGSVVRIPMRLGRQRGRKRILAPDGSELTPLTRPQPDSVLVRTLAQAWRWQKMLDKGRL
jgi:hypothetical protein